MSNNIDQILDSMIALIKQGTNGDWVGSLIKVKSELSRDPKSARYSIMSMYGGMGSLNDVVLYQSGQPLAQENIEFDRLRSELYKLAQSL
jgi:hypothetical protein